MQSQVRNPHVQNRKFQNVTIKNISQKNEINLLNQKLQQNMNDVEQQKQQFQIQHVQQYKEQLLSNEEIISSNENFKTQNFNYQTGTNQKYKFSSEVDSEEFLVCYKQLGKTSNQNKFFYQSLKEQDSQLSDDYDENQLKERNQLIKELSHIQLNQQFQKNLQKLKLKYQKLDISPKINQQEQNIIKQFQKSSSDSLNYSIGNSSRSRNHLSDNTQNVSSQQKKLEDSMKQDSMKSQIQLQKKNSKQSSKQLTLSDMQTILQSSQSGKLNYSDQLQQKITNTLYDNQNNLSYFKSLSDQSNKLKQLVIQRQLNYPPQIQEYLVKQKNKPDNYQRLSSEMRMPYPYDQNKKVFQEKQNFQTKNFLTFQQIQNLIPIFGQLVDVCHTILKKHSFNLTPKQNYDFIKIFGVNQQEYLKQLQRLGTNCYSKRKFNQSLIYHFDSFIFFIHKQKYLDSIFVCLRMLVLIKFQKKSNQFLKFYNKLLQVLKNNKQIYQQVAKNVFSNMGVIFQEIGQYNEALKHFFEAQQIVLDLKDNFYAQQLSCIYDRVGLIYFTIESYDKALENLLSSLHFYSIILTHYDNRFIGLYIRIASTYLNLNQPNKANQFFQKSQQIVKHNYQQKHIQVGLVYQNIGLAYKQKAIRTNIINIKKQLQQKAHQYFFKSLQIFKEKLGQDNNIVGLSLQYIGGTYIQMAKYDKGIEFTIKSLIIQQKLLKYSKQNINYVNVYLSLSIAYFHQGQRQKGIKYSIQALQFTKNAFGQEHFLYGHLLNQIGKFYLIDNKLQESLRHLIRSKQAIKKSIGQKNAYYFTTLETIGQIFQKQNAIEQWIRCYEESLKLKRQLFGDQNQLILINILTLGLAYRTKLQFSSAFEYLFEYVEILKKLLFQNTPDYIFGLIAIAESYKLKQNFQHSLKYFESAQKFSQKIFGKKDTRYGFILLLTGQTYLASENQNNIQKSSQLFLDSILILKKYIGQDHQILKHATQLYKLSRKLLQMRCFKKN